MHAGACGLGTLYLCESAVHMLSMDAALATPEVEEASPEEPRLRLRTFARQNRALVRTPPASALISSVQCIPPVLSHVDKPLAIHPNYHWPLPPKTVPYLNTLFFFQFGYILY